MDTTSHLHRDLIQDSTLIWVQHRSFVVIGWVGIVFFGALAIWLVTQYTSPLVLVLFLPMIALGAALVLLIGSTGVSERGLVYRSRLGTDAITWDEIQEVVIDPYGYQLVFVGRGKQLALLGFEYWSKPQAEPAMELLLRMLEDRQIPERTDPMASFRRTRNCRI